jgi:hypothetical protein
MKRNTMSGVVNFVCYCGTQEVGAPEDARIAGDILHAGETEEMYRGLIKNAHGDRVNQLVARYCRQCGLDYMVQIRVGAREVVIRVCKCGYNSSRVAASDAELPADAAEVVADAAEVVADAAEVVADAAEVVAP